MNTFNNSLKTLGAVVIICVGLVTSSCTDNFTVPAAPGGSTISQVASSSDSLEAFGYLLSKAGLSSNFNNPNGGQFTAFAPSNYAIVKYLRSVGLISIGKTDATHCYDSAKKAIDKIKYLVSSSSPKISLTGAGGSISITAVLDYHFVTSTLPSSAFTGNQVFTTLNGARLSLSKVTGGTYTYLLNADLAGPGANVVTPDISASNGVIHLIDQVMVPVSLANIWDVSLLGFTVDYTKSPIVASTVTKSGNNNVTTAVPRDNAGNFNIASSVSDASDANFNLFTAALIRSNVVTTLLPNGVAILPDFTVFAPTDGAIKALLGKSTEPTALDSLNKMTPDALANLVKYHIVTGRMLTTDLTDGQVVATTLTGKSITIHVSGSAYSVTDAQSNSANVTGANKLTNAGIVHIIDKALVSQ